MTTEEQLTSKQRAIRALETLPDDATIEDAIDCLVVVSKIQAGLSKARQGMLIPRWLDGFTAQSAALQSYPYREELFQSTALCASGTQSLGTELTYGRAGS
jgi:hypothetical protein